MHNPPTRIDFHGLEAIELRSPDGAQAIVTLHGAHVVSWIPASGGERLYLSEQSAYGAETAIRGGIPVIFPQFATEGALPRHGFARTCAWECIEARSGADYAVVTFRLADSPDTRAIWPYAFAAELTVLAGAERLDVELDVDNIGDEALSFTAALHTYLRVREVETVRLEGLYGRRYRDATHGNREVRDSGDGLIVDDEVDRIYFDVPSALLLRAPERALGIHAEGFPDVVVWNPWETKCAALKDMPKDGFRRMLCVEAAAIGRPVNLASGESWQGRQSLVAL